MPLLAIGVGATVLVVLAVLVGVLGVFFPDPGAAGDEAACQGEPGASATSDIPPGYLKLNVAAGAASGVPWNVLAAVGKAESDHGRGPGSGIRSGTNEAGAAGPMQFLLSTWASYGVDGNRDGKKDVYDPHDAIPAAAAYLKHNGAPDRMEKALFAYNHADWYVKKILALAAGYGRGADLTSCETPVIMVSASGRAAVAVKSALRWIGTPYSWGGGSLSGSSEGFGRGAGIVGFDCSSLMRYAWHQARVALPRVAEDQYRATPRVPKNMVQPGDLVFFKGALGSWTRPGHVGMVLDSSRMVEAPGSGKRVRISRWTVRRDLIGFGRPGGIAPGGGTSP